MSNAFRTLDEDPTEVYTAPLRPWLRLVAFGAGLAAAFAAYLLVGPRLPAWRLWTLARLTGPASSSNASPSSALAPAIGSPATEIQATSPGAGSPDGAAVVEGGTKNVERHAASASTRRHRSKHRAASRH